MLLGEEPYDPGAQICGWYAARSFASLDAPPTVVIPETGKGCRLSISPRQCGNARTYTRVHTASCPLMIAMDVALSRLLPPALRPRRIIVMSIAWSPIPETSAWAFSLPLTRLSVAFAGALQAGAEEGDKVPFPSQESPRFVRAQTRQPKIAPCLCCPPLRLIFSAALVYKSRTISSLSTVIIPSPSLSLPPFSPLPLHCRHRLQSPRCAIRSPTRHSTPCFPSRSPAMEVRSVHGI